MTWASAGHTEDWRIAEVAALPWPRCLFRCPLHSALQPDVKFMKDLHGAQAATRRLSLSLSGDDVAKCPYHRPDWRLAADTAVTLLEQTGGLTVEIADQAVRSTKLAGARRCPHVER